MFGEGLDRDSIVTKIVGAVCALAALGGIGVIIAGAGFSMLIIAIACGLISVVCFTELEKEREIFIGAMGAVIFAEILGVIFASYKSSSSVINSIASVILHAGIMFYFFGNFVDRNKAMAAGALIAIDNAWRICSFIRLMAYFDNNLLGNIVTKSTLILCAVGSVIFVVPAIAVTVLLFTGVLDYGN